MQGFTKIDKGKRRESGGRKANGSKVPDSGTMTAGYRRIIVQLL